MTRGRRLQSDGSARCLTASSAQPRTPYVRVAGFPPPCESQRVAGDQSRARGGAGESLPNAEPRRAQPSPAEPGKRQRRQARSGHRIRTSAPQPLPLGLVGAGLVL